MIQYFIYFIKRSITNKYKLYLENIYTEQEQNIIKYKFQTFLNFLYFGGFIYCIILLNNFTIIIIL